MLSPRGHVESAFGQSQQISEFGVTEGVGLLVGAGVVSGGTSKMYEAGVCVPVAVAVAPPVAVAVRVFVGVRVAVGEPTVNVGVGEPGVDVTDGVAVCVPPVAGGTSMM